jgi:hypothetical protein
MLVVHDLRYAGTLVLNMADFAAQRHAGDYPEIQAS